MSVLIPIRRIRQAGDGVSIEASSVSVTAPAAAGIGHFPDRERGDSFGQDFGKN